MPIHRICNGGQRGENAGGESLPRHPTLATPRSAPTQPSSLSPPPPPSPLTPAPCYPELCGDLVHWVCWYCRADLTIYAVPEEAQEEEASQASTSYSANRRRR